MRPAASTLANTNALLFGAIFTEVNWAVLYIEGDTLVLGPFRNRLCADSVGRGVCGAAVAQNKVQRIDDVHAFDGHVPVMPPATPKLCYLSRLAERLSACWIANSTAFGRFTEDEHGLLRALVAQLENLLCSDGF